MRILLLNGPNLNTLGTREPQIYGTLTLGDIETMVTDRATALGVDVRAFQANSEGDLIDWLQREAPDAVGLIINAGAYTHTSVALHDAIKGAGVPVVEVHISNVHAREPFRHHSYLSPAAAGIVVGFGIDGYALAIDGLARRTQRETTTP